MSNEIEALEPRPTADGGHGMRAIPSPLYLGFDLSTQQLKVIALQLSEDGHLGSHSSFAVHFDTDLAHYNTQGGVCVGRHEDTAGVVTTPVLMWVEALELVLDRMKHSDFPFERVKAISGAAQQHGSVYWSDTAQDSFKKMQATSSSSLSLTEIVKDAFTVHHSPIWQDTSTVDQCREIEEFMGETSRLVGQQRLAERTGSRAYERFTASQIMKIVQKAPEIYDATERISLVSSFLASLLMAKYAMIDVADGSGMNLLNIKTKTWDPTLTGFIGRGGVSRQLSNCSTTHENGDDTLSQKLGPVDVHGGGPVQGVISKWFVERYGFIPDTEVISFTGDNPATVMALHAEKGEAIVSLGTSDTLLLYTNNCGSASGSEPTQISHPTTANAKLFSTGYLCHPIDPNGYLMLYCAKNGSLARERVRDLYAHGNWDEFDSYLKGRQGANDKDPAQLGNPISRIGYYFFDREIWPPVQGVFKFEDGDRVEEFSDNKRQANVLGICESQFLTMRIRSSQGDTSSSQLSASSCTSVELTLSPPGISRILATGGASSNPSIL
ncbi:hypothetical protein BGZ98_008940, partial [Dissophora globulifera]